jgi:hypothetical protein
VNGTPGVFLYLSCNLKAIRVRTKICSEPVWTETEGIRWTLDVFLTWTTFSRLTREGFFIPHTIHGLDAKEEK